jgi:nucleoside phosphorylase
MTSNHEPSSHHHENRRRGDLPSNYRELATHAFKPVLVSARTYFTAIQKIVEDAHTLFIQPSSPWSFQCDRITQSFYQLTQPSIPNIKPTDDVQLNSFMIKYHYIIEQVALLASDIHDYGHIRQTRAKQQNIELTASDLLQEVKDALTLIDAFETGAVASLSEGKQVLRERRVPTIGIITALPKEHIAMEVLLENVQEFIVPGEGASRRYTVGEIPLVNGGMRTVVLALLPNMGTSAAATRAVRLLEHFSQVKDIVMVGIAGGVPNPAKPDDHVRLGDIVVSNQYGVIQYDFIKKTREEVVYRPLPHPPGAQLLLAVRYLESGAMKGEHPWNILISRGMKVLHLTRPTRAMDVLISTTEPGNVVSHPKDPKRKAGEPRIFIGPIASANTLLKDAVLRDDLRDRFGVKAIEMEAAGVATASWDVGVGYLVVRGICDYCDDNKNDLWQEYAAVVAAAYTRALLASIPDAHTGIVNLGESEE